MHLGPSLYYQSALLEITFLGLLFFLGLVSGKIVEFMQTASATVANNATDASGK